MSYKKERYNIMLTTRVVKIIDHHAQNLDMSRSELVLQILSDYIVDNNLFYPDEDENIPGQVSCL